MDGRRELDIERIPGNVRDLIREYKASGKYEAYMLLLNNLDSYFTQAEKLKDEILKRNKLNARKVDTYPSDFEITKRMGNLNSLLEDINYQLKQLSVNNSNLDLFVDIANNFPVYLDNLFYDKKGKGGGIVDLSNTFEDSSPNTGYHQ